MLWLRYLEGDSLGHFHFGSNRGLEAGNLTRAKEWEEGDQEQGPLGLPVSFNAILSFY